MDSISLIDMIFGVVTTLILGCLTVIQFRSERRQRQEDVNAANRQRELDDRQRALDDRQLALDIQAAASTSEIFALVEKSPLTSHEAGFLKQTHAIAKARLEAMEKFSGLQKEIQDEVANALQRLFDPNSDDLDVVSRQAEINARFGMDVQPSDRSRFTWNGKGKFSKYDTLHLIAQKFIADHNITTRANFETLFGSAVKNVLGEEVGGKSFDPDRLLDVISDDSKHAARDRKLAEKLGAIQFDGIDYRAGWDLGFMSPKDVGRAAQLPVIEYFRQQPGYEIERI